MDLASRPAAGADYPPRFQAWRIIGVLFLASVVSIIDRGIFSLVIDPIRHDLRITDVQISLLQGFSFGIFYATMGLALGLGADRFSRRNLLLVGILVWSLATILGGLTQNFGQMFATRIAVGLGEATLGPCAISMIGDLFPPTRRGRPTSVYLMGQAVSTGLSVLLTGFILSKLPSDQPISLPLLGSLVPWRITFLTCGALGFIVVGLMLTFRDPVRRGAKLRAQGGSRLRAAALYLRRDGSVFLPLYLSFAVTSAGFYGSIAWAAVFIMRRFDLSPAVTGHSLGIASIIAGLAGPFVAGNLVDIVSRSSGKGGKLRLLAFAPLFALPSAFAVLAPTAGTAIVFLAMTTAAYPIFSTTFLSALQEMVPNDMRGVAVSVASIPNTIIGSAGGPLLIALATEHLYGDPKLVGFSIITVSIPAALIGAALGFLTLRNLRRTLARESGLRDVMMAKAA